MLFERFISGILPKYGSNASKRFSYGDACGTSLGSGRWLSCESQRPGAQFREVFLRPGVNKRTNETVDAVSLSFAADLL